jgi:hypothetical protein
MLVIDFIINLLRKGDIGTDFIIGAIILIFTVAIICLVVTICFAIWKALKRTASKIRVIK